MQCQTGGPRHLPSREAPDIAYAHVRCLSMVVADLPRLDTYPQLRS